MGELSFEVVGRTPLGGGSTSRRSWREAIRDAALEASGRFPDRPTPDELTVEVVFRIAEPRMRSADLDNMVKPVLDTIFRSRDEQLDPALTGALLPVDDASIHRLVVEKHRAEGPHDEGVRIVVRWIEASGQGA